MKYLLLFCESKGEESERAAVRAGGSPESLQAYYRTRMEWMQTNGARLIGGNELVPQAATTVRRAAGGSATITDGPFIEGNEVIGGYALVEAADLDEAIALAKAWPGSVVDIRPIVAR